MEKHMAGSFARTFLAIAFISVSTVTTAQTDKDDIELVQDSRDAMKEFIHTDSLMQNLFNNAYGYVVFPSIGKGAFGVGGASGRGTVFEKGAVIGKAKMTQVTIGFQVGGQAYREVVFFQEKSALDRFKENNVEFSAQVSAVAAKSGASGNAKYTDGILIFTQQKGGLMYEASVGGQKFKYTAFSK
ncbi:MAG TPA: lipid-binding SYLF domain-containing protein [Puia sp.]|jgi:lipid-binding SYLF domain-containing protein|nr:lipid-binding SYLF domain-containing protein [Puia sp.]